MKNVTVSLNEDVYHRARVRAAEAGRSLSALVRDYLETLGTSETEFERLKRMEHKLRADMDAKGIGLRASERMSRDELYDTLWEERRKK